MRQKPVYTRVIAPVALPVTLDEVKAHCRIDTDSEDAILTLYLNAAVSRLDGLSGILGRALMLQTWDVAIPYGLIPWSDDRLTLWLAPAAELVSVKYFDGSNAEITATLSDYDFVAGDWWAYVAPRDGLVWPTVYDRPDALTIRYAAGYADAAAVPFEIKAAILIMVSDMYEHRETVAAGGIRPIASSMAVDNLLRPYRRIEASE
jgi:uncharacterized phiE125 gp8 family phage protein